MNVLPLFPRLRRTLCTLFILCSVPLSASPRDVLGPPEPSPDASSTPNLRRTASLGLASTSASAWGKDLALFLGGGLTGLLIHEAGHASMAKSFGAKVGTHSLASQGWPFFAVDHSPLPNRQEYLTSSAGFLFQNITSEWILTRRPTLKAERAPLAKGILAFHVGTTLLYSGAALLKIGPEERDTRGMAQCLKVNEGWIGGVLLATAALDTYRYYHPDVAWATWTSRGLKFSLLAAAASVARR